MFIGWKEMNTSLNETDKTEQGMDSQRFLLNSFIWFLSGSTQGTTY